MSEYCPNGKLAVLHSYRWVPLNILVIILCLIVKTYDLNIIKIWEQNNIHGIPIEDYLVIIRQLSNIHKYSIY